MDEYLKDLFDDLHKNELSKVGKINLEMKIRDLIKQTTYLQEKIDKLIDFAEHNVGLNQYSMEYVKRDLLKIINESEK